MKVFEVTFRIEVPDQFRPEFTPKRRAWNWFYTRIAGLLGGEMQRYATITEVEQ